MNKIAEDRMEKIHKVSSFHINHLFHTECDWQNLQASELLQNTWSEMKWNSHVTFLA